MNEAVMLGYSKGPVKEYKDLLANNKDKDIVNWRKITTDVNII